MEKLLRTSFFVEKTYFKPSFLLGLQMTLVFIGLMVLGKFQVQYEGDSPSYLAGMELLGTLDQLNHIRTFGYPLFLKLTSLLSNNWAALPMLQLLIHFAAVGWFWSGLARLGMSPLYCLAAATPLVFSHLHLSLFNFLLADSLALSLCIAACGSMFRWMAEPQRLSTSVGLALTVFATYQTRPNYLFFVLFVPLFVFFGTYLLRQKWDLGGLLKSTGICIGPLFVFLFVKLALVGNFNLVSFSGVSSGIALQFLRQETVAKLSPHQQQLASLIFHAKLENTAVAQTGDPALIKKRMQQLNMVMGPKSQSINSYDDFRQDALQCHHPWVGKHNTNFAIITRCFNYTWAALGIGPLKELYGNDLKAINQAISGLAFSIARIEIVAFSIQVIKAILKGLWYEVGLIGTLFFSILFLITTDFLSAARQTPKSLSKSPLKLKDSFFSSRDFQFFLVFSVFYCLAGLLTVVLVQPPLSRYVHATSVFLPSLFVIIGWNRILQLSKKKT